MEIERKFTKSVTDEGFTKWVWVGEHSNATSGVILKKDEMIWFEESGFPMAGGAAGAQSLEDFLLSGPADLEAPEGVTFEILETLQKSPDSVPFLQPSSRELPFQTMLETKLGKLPKEFRELLNTKVDIPSDTHFFMFKKIGSKTAKLWLAISALLFFTLVPFFLFLLYRDWNSGSAFNNTVGVVFCLALSAGLGIFFHNSLQSTRRSKAIKNKTYRFGLYINSQGVLVCNSKDNCHLIPRALITGISGKRVYSENTGRSYYEPIILFKDDDDDDRRLVLSSTDFDGLADFNLDSLLVAPGGHFTSMAEAKKVSPSQVRALWLQNQDLEQVPAEIERFKNLELLSLAGNNLQTLPEFLNTLRKLQHLNLRSNKFHTKEKRSLLEHAKNFPSLSLKSVKIDSIALSAGELSKLEELLPNCAIESFISRSN